MKTDRIKNIKLGLFVTISLILFSYAIYNIGSKQNIFGSTFSLSAVFTNIQGLQVGNNVRFSGINVGTVDNIFILEDTLIRVDMSIVKKVKNFIRKDASVSIGSDGLVGNKIVNINPGAKRLSLVGANDILNAGHTIPTNDMMGTLSSSASELQEILNKVNALADTLQSGQGSLPTLLNNQQASEDLMLMLKNMRRSTDQLLKFSLKINEGFTDKKNMLGFLLNDTMTSQNITSIASNLDTAFTAHTEPVLNNIYRSSEDLKLITEGLRQSVATINESNGILNAVISDSITSAHIKQSLSNLKEGTEKFNDLMEALQHNFLVRGFFKKKEKEKEKEKK